MLDLKAKLAAAGLVTPADVAAAERKGGPRKPGAGPKGQEPKASPRDGARVEPGPARDDRRGAPGPTRDDRRGPPGPTRDGKPGKPAARPALDVPALQKAGKGAAYDAIRRAIERVRLDAVLAIPSEQAEAFHFTTAGGQLSRLMLEPAVRTGLTDGSAAIVAFMSHHGLAHCVVPRPLAEDIHRIFPLWLRVLAGHPDAGQLEPPRPPREPAPAT